MSSSPSQPQAGPQPLDILFQMATGTFVAQSLGVVAELGVADLLAGGAKTSDQIAAATKTHPDAIYRVMRALAAFGVFHEGEAKSFSLTPISQHLRSDTPDSIRSMVRFVNDPIHLRTYAEFMHSVKTQQTAFSKVFGESHFDWCTKNKLHSELFNDAMTDFSNIVIAAVLEVYDFSGFKKLVDVAGGHGALLVQVLKKNPQLKGVLFDLDHVAAGAKARFQQEGLRDRAEVVSGSFFESVPAGGDAYIMKHIIHDWYDDDALKILKQIHKAMLPNGRLLLLEGPLPPPNVPSGVHVIDIEMLAIPGGKERTEAEYRTLLKDAGFELKKIVPTKSLLSVIESVRL